ncbi:hypothetical protein GCM10009804_20340 [Kribbella hippodromi]|uniref:Phage tail protein n=1 Tax=Kribbella hippodromi TaxID=434347 RepID=A0ABN2CWN0_9ACTN
MTIPSLQGLSDPGRLVGAGRPLRESAGERPRLGMTMWFGVSVPRLDSGEPKWLGAWSSCSGLEVNLTPEGPFDEGGNYTAPHLLPGRIGYQKVTLERAMTAEGTAKVRSWLERLAKDWASGGSASTGSPVVVTLYSGIGRNATKIHSWELADPVPVAWIVPQFSTAGGGFAVEKLVLQHSGFLKPALPPAQELQLVGPADETLIFRFNPGKIVLSKAREANNGKKRFTSGTEVIDANSLSIRVGDLRVEGTAAVEQAGTLLRDWLEFEGWKTAQPRLAAKPEQKPLCHECGKTASTPPGAPGTPKALRAVWGPARGGLPETMTLKQFELTITRFTPDGQPSRATVSLTLQEYSPPPTRNSGRAAISSHRGPAATPAPRPPAASPTGRDTSAARESAGRQGEDPLRTKAARR